MSPGFPGRAYDCEGILTQLLHQYFCRRILHPLLVGKLFWEFMNGPLPGSEEMTGGRVVVDAHLYGAMAGFVSVLLTRALHSLHQLVQVKNRQQDTQHD